jgi:hypothetical protein
MAFFGKFIKIAILWTETSIKWILFLDITRVNNRPIWSVKSVSLNCELIVYNGLYDK